MTTSWRTGALRRALPGLLLTALLPLGTALLVVRTPPRAATRAPTVEAHRAAPGGVERYADEVAARDRGSLRTGAIREALGVDRERFEARTVNRYRAAYDAG